MNSFTNVQPGVRWTLVKEFMPSRNSVIPNFIAADVISAAFCINDNSPGDFIMKGETVLNQEIEIECFDKTRKVILNSAMPLKGDDSKIIGAIAINVDITDKKLYEKNLRTINHDMAERVKELRCLYKMSELSNDPEKTMEDILKESVEIIPASYQYPEIACVRIIFDNHTYQSTNFKESIWKQETNITASAGNMGQVQVFYTEQRPEEQDGPFLKEERFLINSIADILSNSAERKKAEVALREDRKSVV